MGKHVAPLGNDPDPRTEELFADVDKLFKSLTEEPEGVRYLCAGYPAPRRVDGDEAWKSLFEGLFED